MDLEEFLTELRLHGGQWKFFRSSGGMTVIRRVSSRVTKVFAMECPITAVCNDLMGTDHRTWTWEQAAQRLGLDHELARQIVSAADDSPLLVGETVDHREELRRRLLEATKVET